MNILILTDYYPPDKIGGVGEIARNLRDAYRALGHTVYVVTTGRRRAEEQRDGVIRSSPRLIWGVLVNNLVALRTIRRHRIDIVHLHQSSTTLFLLLRKFRVRFPTVLTSLQVSYISEAREVRTAHAAGRQFRPGLGEYVERFVFAPAHVVLDFLGYALSDRVTVVSRENRDETTRTFGRVVPRTIEIIPNGVTSTPAPRGEFADRALEERLRGRVVVTSIGVFRARKRVASLVVAMREVATEFPDVRLLLIGGGRGYERKLRQLVAELGLAENVIFAGIVPSERVSYYLSLTDIFCLLSSYEGMPLALLEAMNHAKAVVATDCYGMHDLLCEGDAGVLVPVDDVPRTSDAIKALIRNRERRAVLAANARARVRSCCGWESIASQYLRLAGSA